MKSKTIFQILLVAIILVTFSGCQKASVDNPTSTSSLATEEVKEKMLQYAISYGNPDSKVLIVEASDLECPACKSLHPEFKKVVDAYKDKVHFAYIAFPLNYHQNAMPAALAVEAANQQGKGIDMLNDLFSQEELSEEIYLSSATKLGLDINKFKADRESSLVKEKIKNGTDLLTDLNLTGTPTFYINGKEMTTNPTFESFSQEIDKLLVQ